MKNILNKLFGHQYLTREEAKDLLSSITAGEINDAQIVAVISSLKMRKISADELNGFREALLDSCIRIDLDGSKAIDVCGTGGDGKDTFNISTLTAILIAGAGYPVIKHGNYGVSSICGSSTVLEYLGYQFTADQENLREQLSQTNLCFLHAPLFHPSLKRVGGIRKELGISTFFNYLGPLVNPVQPAYQLTGVFKLELMRLYKEVLQNEREDFRIIHSLDGYDEISLTSAFKLASKKSELIIYPDDLDRKQVNPNEIEGGNSVGNSAEIFMNILSGKGTEAQNSVVCTNAALGIQCMDTRLTFQDAFELAKLNLFNGKSLKNFNHSIKISKNHLKVTA